MIIVHSTVVTVSYCDMTCAVIQLYYNINSYNGKYFVIQFCSSMVISHFINKDDNNKVISHFSNNKDDK